MKTRYYIKDYEAWCFRINWFRSSPTTQLTDDEEQVEIILKWLRQQGISVGSEGFNTTYFAELTPAQATYLELRWGSRPSNFLTAMDK